MLIDFLLRQKCTIRPWMGHRDGAEAYGEPEERPCRLQQARQLENSMQADAFAARALMFCVGEMIPARSRVECEGEGYTVLACRSARGLGQEHLEVTLR